MIYGIGTDIINIERVEHILNKNRDGFVKRVLLNLSQPVFTLTPLCCMFSVEPVNTNFIVFSLIRPGLEPTIYHTLFMQGVNT
jgi:hypothetical protein